MSKIKVMISNDLKDLIPNYLNNRKADLERLKQALIENDLHTINSVCHKINGHAGGYGFHGLKNQAEEIEFLTKGISGQNEELRLRLGGIIDYMDEYLKKIEIEFIDEGI